MTVGDRLRAAKEKKQLEIQQKIEKKCLECQKRDLECDLKVKCGE